MLSTGEGFVTAAPYSGLTGDIGWSMRGQKIEQSALEMAKELVMAQMETYWQGPEVMRQGLRNTHASLMMLRQREEV